MSPESLGLYGFICARPRQQNYLNERMDKDIRNGKLYVCKYERIESDWAAGALIAMLLISRRHIDEEVQKKGIEAKNKPP